MLACNNLSHDNLESIFINLRPKELGVSASVSKAWKNAADQEKFWSAFVPEMTVRYDDLGNNQICISRLGINQISIPRLESKKFLIEKIKSQFFSIFSKELIDAFGGLEKAKDLAYLNFTEPRVLANGIIQLSELNSPLTVGRFLSFPMHKKNKPIEQQDISRYTFLAIRFINREFDPKNTEKDVNIWITKTGSWTLLSGGNVGGWPTRFPNANGCGDDFSKTIEYIGRLVKGEPCGIRDICSPIEHSKLTPLGTSTVILA